MMIRHIGRHLSFMGRLPLLAAAFLALAGPIKARAQAPAPTGQPKPMALDADPSFDVATIKPNNSAEASLRGLGLNGRDFTTKNSSLADLMAFAYGVQVKQIENGPGWMETDRYDVDAVPDREGTPSVTQLRTMVQRLLADRFKLTTHNEKREMPAYVLTAGKGPKLTPTQLTGSFPDVRFEPAQAGLQFTVRNITLAGYAHVLQIAILDRPVVDQTGINGSFDIQVTFTPDDSQFNGHPPRLPPPPDTVEAAPLLFDAIQQQLGLKLAAQKAQVDVIAIDHVEKPSPN